MKTIKHKEFEYQIGALYEFSRFGKNWYVGVLEGIEQGATYPYKVRTKSYKFIKACKVKVGTIEGVPVKLIDGKCYQFTNDLGNEYTGFFSARQGVFFRTGGRDAPSRCTNIKLLTVGEQK